ncbi:hypothetical protein TL16_g12529 [Triparma laevis f. inornata]|uniref:Fe2OG dioxygenase domain-containing protein n=1 Tax=Triparma laevis f. inornata TaxID=1714386 RepID=A0A9W7BKV6_9STRA|nr:hypothetical protein TL16_g12529 [Triparma laevis f. inornata]
MSPIPNLDPSILNELSSQDYAIVPNFLTEEQVDAIIEDIHSLRSDDKFSVAGIGQDASNTINSSIRKTETMFIYPKLQFPTPALTFLYPTLSKLSSTLTSKFNLNLSPFLHEALYAYYPHGGYYKRHVDAVPSSASILRSFSFLIYLNKSWKPEDGGCLRLYTDVDDDSKYKDVEPTSGKLVIFKSDKLPHEVLETSAERLAVVGWFNREVTASDIGNLGGGDLVRKLPIFIASAVLVGVGVSML